jgi:hypothetical protein
MGKSVACRMSYSKSGGGGGGGGLGDILGHNLREIEIDYLLEVQAQKLEIEFKNEFLNYNEKTREETLKKYNELREQKRKIYKSKNTNIRKNENEILEFVLVFSEEQALKYLENNKNCLKDITKQFTKELKNNFGMETLNYSLHMDEGKIDQITKEVKHNFHAHVVCYNYDFEKQKTILRNLKKDDFSKMQDLGEIAAKKMGYDFERGKSKKLTGAEHLNIREYKESREQLNYYTFLENRIKHLQKQKKTITANSSLQNEQKKELHKKIQEQIREIRAEKKEVGKKLGKELNIKDAADRVNKLFEKIENKYAEPRSLMDREKVITDKVYRYLQQEALKEFQEALNSERLKGTPQKVEKLLENEEKLLKEVEELKETEERNIELVIENQKLEIENQKLEKWGPKLDNLAFIDVIEKDLKIEKENTKLKADNEILRDNNINLKNENEVLRDNNRKIKKENTKLKEKIRELEPKEKKFKNIMRM